MIFTSYSYASFLLTTFVVHWCLPVRFRPFFLIAASYVFYASWSWPYAFLLLALTLGNWAYARFVLDRPEGESGPLWPGIVMNIGVLACFKYADFALENVAAVAQLGGIAWQPRALQIVLPLGISFFTFQGVAYLIDVASGEGSFRRLRHFLLFKAFWPQLIAGPIIRPAEIRAQLSEPRVLRYADLSEGARRILQGAFKKVVLADTLATQVDLAFLHGATPNLLDTLVGTLGFGFQIYFDFSAYSDIAIGSARLFGYTFPENFAWPYSARTPQEFWNRWHMTLSRWIRDYLFTPLSMSLRSRPALQPLSLLLAMALCGLWHGAAWTFVLWGVWHGLALVLQRTLLRSVFSATGIAAAVGQWLLTTAIVFAGWLVFRAPSMHDLGQHLQALLTLRGGMRPALIRESGCLVVLVITSLSLVTTWLHEMQLPRFSTGARLRPWLRPALYASALVAAIIMDREATAFIYFQF